MLPQGGGGGVRGGGQGDEADKQHNQHAGAEGGPHGIINRGVLKRVNLVNFFLQEDSISL